VTTLVPSFTADPLWSFDVGMTGQRGAALDRPTYFNFVTVGDAGSVPITLISVAFPEMDHQLQLGRVAVWPESKPELAAGGAPFPDRAPALTGFSLEPTNGIVTNTFEDPRFMSILVEVTPTADGQWRIGPMDLTYSFDGKVRTKRVATEVGDVCTTPVDVPCQRLGA
jgi:hypothetical protein